MSVKAYCPVCGKDTLHEQITIKNTPNKILYCPGNPNVFLEILFEIYKRNKQSKLVCSIISPKMKCN